MKRILSLTVVLSLIGMCLSFPVAGSSEAVSAEAAFELLSALEIMVGDDNGNPNLDANMTRAEFAQLINNILLYSYNSSDNTQSVGFFDDTVWAKNFFGENEDYNELKYPEEKPTTSSSAVYKPVDFEDVPAGHWAYDAVNFVRNYGIMQGTTKTTFLPDENIRTNEVIKCLIVLLGYKDLAELDGGYPDGYVLHAHKLRLTTGIANTEFITRGSIAVMIDNCMDAKMLKFSSISQSNNVGYDYDNETTFLTEILGLEKMTGIMTDNGYTSILKESSYDGKFIVIGNTRLKVSEDDDFSDFIGRDVDCWYKNSKTEEFGKVVFLRLNNKDKVTEIDGDIIESVSGNQIHYTSGEYDVKHIDVSGAYVIYNGIAASEFETNVFDIDYGTVSVVETRDDRYKKIVVINEFETWYVSNIDPAENIIFNGLKKGAYIDDGEIMELELDNPEYNISIYHADGSKAVFENIKKGSVLDVIRNGKLIKIYISNNVISDFRVVQIRKDTDKTIISDGESSFELTTAFEKNINREEIRVDDILTLYLNRNDRVAWAVNQTNSDLQVAYVLHCGNPDKNKRTNEVYAVKIYTLSGMFRVYNLAEKVKISDDTGEIYRITAESYYNKYKDYEGICRYTINDDDEISYVEFPILDPNTTINGKLHLILETDEDTKSTDGYFRANQINSFGAKALLNSNSKVINYNPDPNVDVESSFSIGSASSFSDDSDNIVKLYSDVEGSFTGKYVIKHTESLGNDFNTLISLPDVYIVTDTLRGIYPDGNIGDMIYTKKFKMSTIEDEILYLNDGCMENILTEAETGEKDGSKNIRAPFNGTLEPGDLIRVSKDSGGYVESIRIIWDENGRDDDTMTPGMIPGMKKYWESGSYNTNPFAINGASGTGYNLYDGKPFGNGSFRVYYGFPYKVREGGVKLTTWDLPAYGYNDSIDETMYLSEVWNITRVVTVNIEDNGNITVKRGAASDIKPYDEFGKECSRIINLSRFATIDGIVVVNGYSKK